MPKKSACRNGFYLFMLDWKARAEAKGRKFANLAEVQANPELSAEWQALSPSEKAMYTNRASNAKNAKKKTTLGDDVDLVEKEQREKELFLSTMIETISDTVQLGLKQHNLHKLNFYFIHVNYFFVREMENGEVDYFPAEFAVGKFSVENGITEVYHEIVSSKLPVGFAREAKERSALTHQIPYDFPGGQHNYNLMYKKLINFLTPDGNVRQLPPLYSTKENSAAVLSLLNKMMNAAGVELNTFIIYSIEQLFSSIYNSLVHLKCSTNIPNVIAEHQFLNNTFAHVSGIECAFHKILDGTSQHCSMAIVKQWCFIICDHCCDMLQVQMIKGIHSPFSKYPADSTDSLNESLSQLNLDEVPKPKVQSMTGVSLDYTVKTSEKTKEEIERARKQQKPVTVIDHSKLTNQTPQSYQSPAPVLYERPLRAPKTTSFASRAAAQKDTPDLNDMNFPKIGGRGMAIRSHQRENMPPIGRGMSQKQ